MTQVKKYYALSGLLLATVSVAIMSIHPLEIARYGHDVVVYFDYAFYIEKANNQVGFVSSVYGDLLFRLLALINGFADGLHQIAFIQFGFSFLIITILFAPAFFGIHGQTDELRLIIATLFCGLAAILVIQGISHLGELVSITYANFYNRIGLGLIIAPLMLRTLPIPTIFSLITLVIVAVAAFYIKISYFVAVFAVSFLCFPSVAVFPISVGLGILCYGTVMGIDIAKYLAFGATVGDVVSWKYTDVDLTAEFLFAAPALLPIFIYIYAIMSNFIIRSRYLILLLSLLPLITCAINITNYAASAEVALLLGIFGSLLVFSELTKYPQNMLDKSPVAFLTLERLKGTCVSIIFVGASIISSLFLFSLSQSSSAEIEFSNFNSRYAGKANILNADGHNNENYDVKLESGVLLLKKCIAADVSCKNFFVLNFEDFFHSELNIAPVSDRIFPMQYRYTYSLDSVHPFNSEPIDFFIVPAKPAPESGWPFWSIIQKSVKTKLHLSNEDWQIYKKLSE